jgi:hypothetical protein
MLNVQVMEFVYCAVALILVLGIKDLDEINSNGIIDSLKDERRRKQVSLTLRFNWLARIESLFFKRDWMLHFSKRDLLAGGSIVPSTYPVRIIYRQDAGILKNHKFVKILMGEQV